jgi:tetratricopeptide (TPR) repeat protein
MANVYQNIGKYDEALNLYKEALKCSGLPETLWRMHYGIGLCEKLGKRNNRAARGHFEKAIENIRVLRGMQSSDTTKTAVIENALMVYEELINLCISEQDYKAAIEYIEETKSQNLAEKIIHKRNIPRNTPPEVVDEYERRLFKLQGCRFLKKK